MQLVLQLLLEEGVHIRDMSSIVECLAEHAATVTDPTELARRIRVHLSPAIVQQIYGPQHELPLMVVEPELEKLLTQAAAPGAFALEPGLAETLSREVGNAALYLLSDMGSAVTGENLHVDAGYHIVGMKAEDAPDIAVSKHES